MVHVSQNCYKNQFYGPHCIAYALTCRWRRGFRTDEQSGGD